MCLIIHFREFELSPCLNPLPMPYALCPIGNLSTFFNEQSQFIKTI
jgi:hypothetical protein